MTSPAGTSTPIQSWRDREPGSRVVRLWGERTAYDGDVALRDVASIPGPSDETRPTDGASSLSAESRFQVGSVIGRYVVTDLIGSGGMGSVARAYDPKLRREVALKRLLTRDPGGPDEARLVREAQAMAQLSHPNVVAVHDVEVASDSGVTIAMEYVPGTSLQGWLRGSDHSWQQILPVFIAAARGLAAAHRAGLVHRDFKPANVLIGAAASSSNPEIVKVTDFGIAKGVGESSASDTLSNPGLWSGDDQLTQSRVALGTPRYMAPEQHAGKESGVTADQYAFCVALWEAVTSSPPFRSTDVASLAAAKIAGPPPWPTTNTLPRRMADAIRRGLSPKSEERWPSMDALIAVLHRDSDRQRRRLVWGVGGMAIVGVSAAFALGESPSQQCAGAADHLEPIWNAERKAQTLAAIQATEVPFAIDVSTRVGQNLDAYVTRWADEHHEACAATTIRGEQSAQAMDLRMACLHRSRRSLSSVVELLEESDRDVVRRASSVLGGLPSLDQCADLEALKAELPLPEDPDVLQELERMQGELAALTALGAAGKHDEALPRLASLVPKARAVPYAPFLAEVMFARGDALHRVDRENEAEPVLREAAQLAMESGPAEIAVRATARLAHLLAGVSRADEAQWLAWVALGLARRHDPGGALEASGHEATGAAHFSATHYEEARASFVAAAEIREAQTDPDFPAIANTLGNLAVSLEDLGQLAESERVQRRALEILQRERGEMHPRTALAHESLARVLERLHRAAEAKTHMLRSIEIQERFFGPTDPRLSVAYDTLGTIHQGQGNFESALQSHRHAYELAQAGERGQAKTVYTVLNMVSALQHLDRPDEALELLVSTHGYAEEALGAQHPLLGNLFSLHADVLMDKGDFAGAQAKARHALEILGHTYGPKHAANIDARVRLAESLVESSQFSGAIPILEAVLIDVADAEGVGDRPSLARALLARTLAASGSKDETRIVALAREARDWYGDDTNPRFAAVVTDLDTLLRKLE